MANDVKKATRTRPLDPTQNAEDVLGESGATGITKGSSEATSATPHDVDKDDSRVRGGEMSNSKGGHAHHIDPSLYSDKAYNEKTLQGMSGVRKFYNTDDATEDDKGETMQELPNNITGEDELLRQLGNDSQEDAEREITTSEAAFTHDHNIGQQDAVGGSESAPESGVDVGEMRERMGLGVDMDGIDPQELSTADAIDEAEQYHRDH